MKTTHMWQTICVVFLFMVYTGGYVASVQRLHICFSVAVHPLYPWYDHAWQRVLFAPMERIDQWLFPDRWRYDHTKQK